MENITHSLTGYFLSRSGLNRFTPNATLLLILSANAPDIDIVALAAGRLNYFHYHRHITHSLIFAPILALILVTTFRLLFRKPFRVVPAFLVSLAGIASHLVLDLTNEYGERIFLPFSGKWLAWDITSLYDIWIWSFFALCLAGPILSRLVGGEIGAPSKQHYPPTTSALVALSFLVVYDGGRAILHARAEAIMNARQYNDTPAISVSALPNPTNPLHWRGIATAATDYRVYDLDLLASFNPDRGRRVDRHETSPQIAAAATTEPCRIVRDFSRFPVWQIEPTDVVGDSDTARLYDLRFPFSCSAKVYSDGRVLSSAFQFNR